MVDALPIVIADDGPRTVYRRILGYLSLMAAGYWWPQLRWCIRSLAALAAGGDSSEQAAAPLPGAGSTAALLGIPGARSFELRCKPRLSPSGAAQPTILVGQGRAACPCCHGRDAAQADTDTRVVQYRLTPPSPRTTFSTYEMSLHVTGVPGVTGVPNDTPTAPEEVHVIVKWNDKTFNVPLREVSMLFDVIAESIDHVFASGVAHAWRR